MLSYTAVKPHMKTWDQGNLLGQSSHSIINRTLECLNSQMNIGLAADLRWDLGAEERLHPSRRLGRKGYQTPSEMFVTG